MCHVCTYQHIHTHIYHNTALCIILQNFTPEFNAVYVDGAFEGEEAGQNINHVVVEHFLRQGQLDIAESLIAVF